MGLVELLIAMTVMSIGIFALVAGFSSGHVTLKRASTNSTAAALADEQMEAFRAARWDAVGLDPAAAVPTDATYTGDPANAAAQIKVKKAETTTSADVDDAVTTLAVAAATGFPIVYPFDVVIQTAKDDQSAREIVSVTGAAGPTTWTVTRAQSGTTAVEHPAGSYVASVNYVANLGCASADYCQPMRTEGRFRIDTYVTWSCPIGTIGGTVDAPTCTPSGTTKDRPAKLVTIVVREAADPAETLVREASTFDESSG